MFYSPTEPLIFNFMKKQFLVYFLCLSTAIIAQNNLNNSLNITDVSNLYGITTAGFRDIYIDNFNRKWISTVYSGILMIDGRNSHRLTSADSISSNFIFRVNQDAKGNIWAATFDGITELTTDGKILTFLKGKEKNNFFTYVYQHPNGNLYAMGLSGLFTRTKNSTKWEKIEEDAKPLILLHAAKGKNDTSYFLGKQQLYYTTKNSTQPIPYLTTLTQNNYKIYIDSKQRIWIISLDGLGYIQNGLYHLVSDKMGFLSAIEFKQNLYFGTNGYGLHQLSDTTLSPLKQKTEIGISALSISNNDLWIIGNGCMYKANESINHLTDSNKLVKANYFIYIDKESCVFLDKHRSIYYKNKTKQFFLTKLSSNPTDNIRSAFKINEQEVVISTYFSLFKFNINNYKIYNIKLPLSTGSNTFTKYKDTLFVGRMGGVFKLVKDTLLPLDASLKLNDAGTVAAMCLLKDKLLYFKSGAGLFTYSNGQIQKITMPQEMQFQSVSSMRVFEEPIYNGQYILIIHTLGINIGWINPANNQIFWQTKNKFQIEALYLGGTFFQDFSSNWYDAMMNQYQFDISKISPTLTPNFICRILKTKENNNYWSGYNNSSQQTYLLSSGTKYAIIQWQVPSDDDVAKLYHVQYTILHHTDTLTANNSDGTFQLLFENPGDYCVSLKLIDNLNNTVLTSTIINITISPFWYQTLLFKIASVILLLISIIALTYIFIQSKNKQKFKNLQNKIESISLKTKAIQNIMAPHLLFNLFNNLQSKILNNNKEGAAKMIERISMFFRQTIESYNEDRVTLTEELNYINNYVQLNISKLNSTLTTFKIVNLNSVNTDTILFPSLILQPLVENAIKYGAENNVITLSIELQNNICTINVISLHTNLNTNKISTSQGHTLIMEKLKLINYKYQNIQANFSCGYFENGYKATITLNTN